MDTDTKIARKVRDLRLYAGTRESLYYVDPPMETELGLITHYVAVVAGKVNGFEEVVIFPATEHGDVLEAKDMDGSMVGSLDHEAALSNAGYDLEDES